MEFKPMQPGIENTMNPRPVFDDPNYRGSGKLNNKVAIITGGDSGIGRAVGVAFAKEGADIAVVYYNEHDDANETKACIEKLGRKCLLIPGDLREESFCQAIVERTLKTFGHIDILVNNAAVQYPKECLEDICGEQLLDTFQVNVFAPFFLIKAALPHLKWGSVIINTVSITAYIGNKLLVDYSASKGALLSLTRSLSLSLLDKGIRVNGVAPGPIWTPLVIAGIPENLIKEFGKDTPMKRAGQPFELAPAYVWLASNDSGYVTGQIVHVNGGNFISS